MLGTSSTKWKSLGIPLWVAQVDLFPEDRSKELQLPELSLNSPEFSFLMKQLLL